MEIDISTTLPKVRTTRNLADTQKIEYPTKYYNLQYENLPEVNVGNTVRLRQKTYPRKLWDTKGSVIAKLQEPRSYKILKQRQERFIDVTVEIS